jgi:hypothetical protein
LTRLAVGSHGGDPIVESTEHHGTAFTLVLPHA